MLTEQDFKGRSLCVVGNINRDIKTAPVRPTPNIFSDGETAVGSIVETIGGGGANSAFAAAALGGRAAFFGKTGADGLGDRLEKALEAHGVRAHLARDPAHPSGTSIALSFDGGQRHFLSCLPASRALKFEDLDVEAMRGYDHLLRADIWFSEEMLFGGNRRLFEAARGMGLRVSIDLNWDPSWGVASRDTIRARKEAVRAALPLVHLAHGNMRELCEFAETPDLDGALRRLTAWGVEAVVVHMGVRGAGYFHNGTLQIEPPKLVEKQVNTTGTGDVLSVCMMLLDQSPKGLPAGQMALANRVVAEFMEGKMTLVPGLAG